MSGGAPVICALCVEIHGRDTNQAVACPVCDQVVGCLWHGGASPHIRSCMPAMREATRKPSDMQVRTGAQPTHKPSELETMVRALR